ncbi:S26 family signal peptidase [Streptomyces sp. NPDC001135]
MVVITVKGVSMRPTLRAGDVLIGRRTGAGRLRSGQIVVVGMPEPGAGWKSWSRPDRASRFMIKQLAAVPGEVVPAAGRDRLGAGTVPAGSVVVLGDNLQESVACREIGYFPVERGSGWRCARIAAVRRTCGGNGDVTLAGSRGNFLATSFARTCSLATFLPRPAAVDWDRRHPRSSQGMIRATLF